jgi:hypothetical protein
LPESESANERERKYSLYLAGVTPSVNDLIGTSSNALFGTSARPPVPYYDFYL